MIKPLQPLSRYEKGTRNFDLHPSHALHSIRASTLRTALKALEAALSDLVSEDARHINSPRRFDIGPWISNLQIAFRRLGQDPMEVAKPAT